MKEKGLAYYLKYPEQISEVSDEEINDLLSKYPYAQSLQWLKARKQLDANAPDRAESIRQAAAYSDDLIFLRYQLLRDQSELEAMADQLQKEEDMPETATTKDKVVDTKMAAKEDVAAPSGEKKLSQGVSKASEEVKKEKKKKEKKASGSKTGKQKPKIQETLSSEDKQQTVDEVIQKFEEELSDFSKWLMTQGSSTTPAQKEKNKEKPSKKKSKKTKAKKKKEKKASKKNKLQKLIDHSIVEQEELVTETYAQLVADQGHTAKAIELYEKLILKMPEKSSYFAGKIEELKNS